MKRPLEAADEDIQSVRYTASRFRVSWVNIDQFDLCFSSVNIYLLGQWIFIFTLVEVQVYLIVYLEIQERSWFVLCYFYLFKIRYTEGLATHVTLSGFLNKAASGRGWWGGF